MEETTQPVAAPEIKAAEKPKKCKHVVVIIILTFLLAGSLAFGVVELILNLQKKPANCEISTNTSQNASDANNGSKKTTPSDNNDYKPTDDIEHGKITLTIEAKTKVVELDKSIDQNYNETLFAIGDNWYYIDSNRNAIVIEISDGDFDGRVFPEDVSKSFKVGGTLKQIMIAHFGNGGNEAVLMLREDGTVAAIRCDDEYGFIYQDKLDGLNNVKAIYEGGDEEGADAFAVDANGKAHSLILYIWPELAN